MTTDVIFRRWPDGSVVALFPGESWDYAGYFCASFEHVGQHGGADYQRVIARTKPASAHEYARLRRELEAEPYNYHLRVLQRATAAHRRQRHNRLDASEGRAR